MDLKGVFSTGGLLDKHTTNYEFRQSQLDMAKVVETALAKKTTAVIEGATGVGKSFAYLVPALLSGAKRVIVSTSNRSLQDQLNDKDLPKLKSVLPDDFEWTVLKGRSNYFCYQHYLANQDELLQYIDKLSIQKIGEWGINDPAGDMSYYPDKLPSKVLELVTCDQHTKHERGSQSQKMCKAEQAKERTKTAKVILVNHTLLALDAALKLETDGKAKIIPNSDVIIMDEAHAFERFASLAFSESINKYSVKHFLDLAIVRASIDKMLSESTLRTFVTALQPYEPPKMGMYYQQTKFDRLDGFTAPIEFIKQCVHKVKYNPNLTDDETTQVKKQMAITEGNNLVKKLQKMSEPNPDEVRWSEAYQRKGYAKDVITTLKSSPLSIAGMLKATIFDGKTVICTSATLAVNGRFDFFREQVGYPEGALEHIAPSPFDFKAMSLVYISDGEGSRYKELEHLINASKGRAFVLFTSYRDMVDYYNNTNFPYPKFIQEQGVSRVQLLKSFKETPNAVLFATRSFWEGIDIQGEQLVHVIIHKIPFGNPSDLLYSTKTKRIDEKYGQQGAHWMRYTVPEACLVLKQGVGRLIRSTKDFGVISLLDSRIATKGYGKVILRALPPAYRTQRLENVDNFFEKHN